MICKFEFQKDTAHVDFIYEGNWFLYSRGEGILQALMEDEPEKYQSHFSEYIKRGIEPDGME